MANEGYPSPAAGAQPEPPAGHQPYVPDSAFMDEFTWQAVLVGTGLAATSWGLLRGHWLWAVASLGVLLLILALRIRRVRARRNIFFCASTDTPRGI